MLPDLANLPAGVTDIRKDRPEFGLDYAHGNFVQLDAMQIAPFQRVGPENNLRDFLEPVIRIGISDPTITLYAFGEMWGPEPGQVDKYFGFTPGRGIHDIHMNQGSSGRFQGDNGVNQYGALLVHLFASDLWRPCSWRFKRRFGAPMP